jgi:hypothetical protein
LAGILDLQRATHVKAAVVNSKNQGIQEFFVRFVERAIDEHATGVGGGGGPA